MNEELKYIVSEQPKMYNIAEILTSLLDEPKDANTEKDSIRPSQHIDQMSLTTDGRMNHLLKSRNKRILQLFPDHLVDHNFETLPSVIIFQRFNPGESYNVPFSVRNTTQVLRYLKTSCELDPFFSVEVRGSDHSSMVAPGLSQFFNIKFNPEEKRDYEYRIKFLTDSGSLIVPVIAIGPRAILDFPDRIELPETAVKITSTKSILVRNIGDAAADFSLYSNSSCFWIEPSRGRIEEEQTLQFTAYFLSDKLGDFEARIFLEYESGERIRIDVSCSTKNCAIRLDRGSVRMEETYLGMSRSKILTIHNRSDYIVKFQWMRFQDKNFDKQQRKQYQDLFHLVYESERARCVDLDHYNICTPDVHQMVCQRIYADEILCLMKDTFRYSNTCFAFTPDEGEIWPQSTVDVNVLFYALKVGEITSTAYLEVTGIENRIPLSLYGVGKGPVFRLNLLTVDVGNIYLCSVNNYEIIAVNKGHIDGTLSHRPKQSDFGGIIKVTPPTVTLKPDQHGSFNLSFSSNRKGDFVERVDFIVKESLEVLSLHIKGCIICPTLHFDKESLDFGTISLGFSARQEVYLHNLSLMPVTFSITVLSDGDQPPLIYEDFAKALTKPCFPTNPREFAISPEEGVVPAHSSLKIKVTYTANIVRNSQTMIRVDMWDSDSDPVTLPVVFAGKVAALSIKPTEISIRFCFLNFPYSRSLTVENASDLDGFFYLVPQTAPENTPIIYSVSMHQGVIKAHQSKTINVNIITKVLGRQSVVLNMLTMGEKSPVVSSIIQCNGQGPIVSADPTSLDFGDVQVLEEKIMNFLVISDAPIPAQFKIALSKRTSPWSVHPEFGELPPNGSMEIKVKLYLRDVGKYSDNIILLVVSSRSIPVYLTANGVGCSVLFEPNVFPTFDMGLVFSHQKVSHPITMKNLGTRNHQIVWSNEPELHVQRGQATLPATTKFHLHPAIVDVPAGETITVHCKLRWDTNETVQEDWYVFGQIQGQGKRELIGTSCFKVTLTVPQILFSKRELMFRVDICPDGDKLQETDELFVTNQSRLDLNVQLAVEPPFNLLIDNGERLQKMKIVLFDGATTKVRLRFSPTMNPDNLYSQKYNRTLWLEYVEHPNKDRIKCTGWVNFPNLTLSSRDLIINCELGSGAEEILTLANNGPVSVTYKFYWIGESIEIKRDMHADCESIEECASNSSPNTTLKICEICTELATSEEITSNRRNGSGDGPVKPTEAPTNSPASEEPKQSHKSETQSTNEISKIEEYEISPDEMKEFLLPIVQAHFIEDTEIPALECLSAVPATIDCIDEVLAVIPRQGTVPPYSVHHVHFGFQGFEKMEIKASIACDILRGPVERINILARSDVISFSVNKTFLDFGQQLLCEPSRKHFLLKNRSTIPFAYKIDRCTGASSGAIDRFDVNPLKIEPNVGFVDPQSSVKLNVEHRLMVLGPIDLQFKLEVGHLMPLIIRGKAFGTIPQVYPCIPRGSLHWEHSAELGYYAIQSLTTDFIIKKDIPCSDDCISKQTCLPEFDLKMLSVDGWDVVSGTETLPSIIDIEMAVERVLARRFLDENSYVLTKCNAIRNNQPIPGLFSPEYVIDMGHVLIGLTAHYSTTFINYGPRGAYIKLQKRKRKNDLAKHGILVQFKMESCLMVGETAALHVTWHPSPEKCTERSTQIKHTIYFEVTNGCTIPVSITGTVTYPYVTVNTKVLDFQDVFTGECLMMCILIKNEGLVDCRWTTELAFTGKTGDENPFEIHYDSKVYPPGHSGVIQVFFKPKKSCFVERKLHVIVEMGLETQCVTLTGRGIERKLNVVEPVVNFAPVVPFTETPEALFTIENPHEYPVEFFWHHLDDSFANEDRVAKVLTHYYRVQEVLLPPRKLGDAIPSLLTDFYNDLVGEMARALSVEVFGEKGAMPTEDSNQQEAREDVAEDNNKEDRTRRKRKVKAQVRRKSVGQKAGGTGLDAKKDEARADSSSDSENPRKNSSPLLILDGKSLDRLTGDAEEIRNLLDRYIDGLHQKADFPEKMRDPVKELFENIETKSAPLNNPLDLVKPEKKVCITFHGAPFTEYQEVACRSARALKLPVLCVDKAILEILALGDSLCSIKLREIVDEAYQVYLATFEKHKTLTVVESAAKKENVDLESEKQGQSVDGNEEANSGVIKTTPRKKSPRRRIEKDKKTEFVNDRATDTLEEIILPLRAEPDPSKEFDKIPESEKLETLDPLSRYEYKVRAILQLQKILPSSPIVGSTRDKISVKSAEKTGRRRQDDTFLGIDPELLEEALRDRLSMEDFKRGFVTQTLTSTFFNDNIPSTFVTLLRIIGHVEYMFVVTFLNSMNTYNRKVDELRRSTEKSAEKRARRIREIEEMSSSEYDLLSEEDKKMYLEEILPSRKKEALLRRSQFIQRITELKNKKEVQRQSTSKTAKSKRTVKSAKSKLSERSSRDKKSTISKHTSSKKGSKVTKNGDSSKHRKDEKPGEMKRIEEAMDRYQSNLSAIEVIIKNWDPSRKIVGDTSPGRSKISRTGKSRDKGSPETSREEAQTNNIHTWYINSSDPWNRSMDDIVVHACKEFLLKAVPPEDVKPEPDLESKTYSIFAPRNLGDRLTSTCDAFELTSMSMELDGSTTINESIRSSDIHQQGNQSEPKENRRRRRHKLPSKTDDQRSMNASRNLENRDPNNMSTLEVNKEQAPKPRWILQPKESLKFKIRFRPEEAGIYQGNYALTIVDAINGTYRIDVNGIADIPNLNMDPKMIFAKVENTKTKVSNAPTYFIDSGTYDFGSILVLRKDKRVHIQEGELKFHNISQIDAEVSFSLTENHPGSFLLEPKSLLLPPGEHGCLHLSAIATKLGEFQERLYLCVKNNPKVEAIELRSSGTKLDVEFDGKELSFGRVLLYRRDTRISTIRNKCAVPIFWFVQIVEPAEPQITFVPSRGTVGPWSEEKIEFCYHGTTVGVVEKKMKFKVFLYEKDEDPIFVDTIVVSGETYDVAVDILHANPIDLKHIKVGFPASAFFAIKNRGNYEVKYVVMLENKEKLQKITRNTFVKIKECLDIRPASGSVQPQKQTMVQVTFVPKSEFTLKEASILKCHLLDTNNQTTLIAELPISVSLISYYTRFRISPYPTVDFGSLAVCTEKTIYLNIENTGNFPLHYSIFVQPDRHPSVMYMSQIKIEGLERKKDRPDRGIDTASKKDKKSPRTEKTTLNEESKLLEVLKIGPVTITKTEGDVDVGQTDSIAMNCYPECVGSQEEQITILVDDSPPEDRSGKILTLSVNSYVPGVDFQDLNAMFRENHIVDRIEDFDCPLEIGAHTVFALQEKCLYFRYVSVASTHATCFKLYNRNVIPADVEVLFLPESLTPKTAKSDTFLVEPRRERIPPLSHKTFTVSFAPSHIQTVSELLEVVVDLPVHLRDERFIVKLVGESCVPEVTITEPPGGKREQKRILNFGRTLLSESSTKEFALKNTGFVEARVIVEIYKDPNFLFTIAASPDTQQFIRLWDYEYHSDSTFNERCTVIRLMPENVARFGVTFCPRENGKYEGQIRLYIVNNPYENLVIDLVGDAYLEFIVFAGLELVDNRTKIGSGYRDSSHKAQKVGYKQSSLISASVATVFAVSLTYDLSYGGCFVNKMYKTTFKIANKSTDRWFRFQWNAHPDIVFVPLIGHLKYQTSKEIIATFLSSEPTIHAKTCIDCAICEIKVADPSGEMAWDDRQTEVRWKEMDSGVIYYRTDMETLARKVVEPIVEPDHDVVPGSTKSIRVLLNATVAFSEYSCLVREINFKDTLMLQTREYQFTLSNPGTVNTTYVWKINMDEQYPKRFLGDTPDVMSRPRSTENIHSRPSSRSWKERNSSTNELRRETIYENEMDDSGDLKFHRFGPIPTHERTIEIKPPSNSCRRSDLFSSTAGLTERTTDSWLEGDDLPFEIYPVEGSLLPEQSVQCTLKFSPKDVFHYKAYLVCRMENLNPKLPELVIPIAARSLLPYCHFDVEESDYVSNGRRDPKLSGPVGYDIENSTLWENIRVIEFKVVGIGETHVKKFHLINPTADDYHFTWTDRTLHSGDDISNFHCTVPEGVAERGKRTDLAFTFLAEDVGIFESFWLFSIEKYNLESLFLFVGVVTEPSVYCLTVHLKLKPTILGISVRDSVKIINREDFQIPFEIVQKSLHSEGKFQSLIVTPMAGTLPPKDEQTLWIEYRPSRVGEFQFSLQCRVKTMTKPLTIFVTASAHDIVCSVSYTDRKGQIVEAQIGEENIINLGKLMVNESCTVKFDVSNSGKMAFHYSWDIGMSPEIVSRNMYTVTIPQRQGHVTSDCRSTCYLTIRVFQKLVIKDHSVVLKISRGPTYRFLIKAIVKKPSVEFNFDHYDFGPCYIRENNSAAYQTELRITNSDSTAYIVECKYEEQPHMSVNLKGISEALTALSTVSIPISFRPLKETKYREYLVFTINSTMERKVTIIGEGIPYKIRLVNPRDKSIDLGSIPVNKTVTRKVQVVNEGRASIQLRFDLMKNLSAYEEHRQRTQSCLTAAAAAESKKDQARASITETKRSGTNDAALQTGEPELSAVLNVEPSTDFALAAGKRTVVIVRFRPTYRMRPFVGKIGLQTSSTILPLFVVRGSCIAAEFHLNRDYVTFGAVALGCSSETRILLMNTGDIGARFKWNTSKFPADFSITPVSGYCSAGMDVKFTVRFQPTQHYNLIKFEAPIEIEKYGSCIAKISGACCTLPTPTEILSFVCNVREKQTKAVTITNSGNLSWKLEPEVTGTYFTTDRVLHVPPNTSITCLVTYAPLVMNDENSQHEGSLFLKRPNGDAPISYSLRGLSLPPRGLSKILRKFPAKTKYTESLAVHNWLDVRQRFQCKIELLNINKVQSKKVPLFTFTGNDKIDVPPNAQRDFHAVFHSHEESTFRFKVTFTNEENEYEFYEIEYEVTKPEIIESIKLNTAARTKVCSILRLENPLQDKSINYTALCQYPAVMVHDMPRIVSPMSYEYVNVEYSPILPADETIVNLDFSCQELGIFPYELRLKATPALPEKLIRVNAVLGSSVVFSLPLNNSTKKNAEFTIKTDNDSFSHVKSVEVAGLKEVSINVVYEPCDIEDVTATLIASSTTAGDFIFPIIGTYSLPKPQGPYTITKTTPASISFKNIFKESKTFEFFFDVPETFTTEAASQTVKSKQNTAIKVWLRDQNVEANDLIENYPVTGKLTVCCKDYRLSHINWIYYLKGIYD